MPLKESDNAYVDGRWSEILREVANKLDSGGYVHAAGNIKLTQTPLSKGFMLKIESDIVLATTDDERDALLALAMSFDMAGFTNKGLKDFLALAGIRP